MLLSWKCWNKIRGELQVTSKVKGAGNTITLRTNDIFVSQDQFPPGITGIFVYMAINKEVKVLKATRWNCIRKIPISREVLEAYTIKSISTFRWNILRVYNFK